MAGLGSTIVEVAVESPSGNRSSTRVPADIPVNELAPALGALVSVANVSELEDGSGKRLPGSSTLAEAGVGEGAVLRVVAPGGTTVGVVAPGGTTVGVVAPGGTTVGVAAPGGRSDRPPSPPLPPPGRPVEAETITVQTPRAAGQAQRAEPAPWEPVPERRRRSGVLAGVVAVVAIVALAIGVGVGALIWSGGGSTTSTAAAEAVATDAAEAWIRATPFTGPTDGVPSSLSRAGALAGATYEPLGTWHHGELAGATFAITAGTTTFGLTVVTSHGRLAFAPTVGPIPFVTGQRVPAAPPAPAPAPQTLPGPVGAWANDVFGPKGAAGPFLGVTLLSPPTAIASWAPPEGGIAYRVAVPLSSQAPGAPGAVQASSYQALAARAASDATANSQAQAANTQAQVASQAAATANAAANPPNPALQAQAASAAAAAAAALQRAQTTAAQAAASQAQLAKMPKPSSASATTTIATYDVWMRAQAVVGWQPADYGIG